MIKLIHKIKRTLGKGKYGYLFVQDIPNSLHDDKVYIVGAKGHSWLIIFMCPCGCREKIYLNLLTDTSPRWYFTVKWWRISIAPSVRRIKGCGSHFFIKRGRIIWCKTQPIV